MGVHKLKISLVGRYLFFHITTVSLLVGVHDYHCCASLPTTTIRVVIAIMIMIAIIIIYSSNNPNAKENIIIIIAMIAIIVPRHGEQPT